jgi:hypothetical protein
VLDVFGVIVEFDAEPLRFGFYAVQGVPYDLVQVGRRYLQGILTGVHLGEDKEFLNHSPDALELLVGEL